MFIGNMGTRSILKNLPKIKNQEIAMFFPWSGDKRLRNPQLTHIINGPGLLRPQVEEIVDYIIENIKHRKISIFHADDAFSTTAADHLRQKLQTEHIIPRSIVSYNRYTLDIMRHADTLIDTDPKIVICVSTSMPTVRLINRFFERGHYTTLFFGVDSTLFVGKILKAKGAQFYYAAAVPNPEKDTSLIAQEYRKNLKKFFKHETPNILSFTYYICAKIIVEALRKAGGIITKEQIIQTIEAMKNYNLAGFMVNFNPENRHAFGSNISIIKG